MRIGRRTTLTVIGVALAGVGLLAWIASVTVARSDRLLAIGLKDVWPDIPGLSRAYGSTAHVCPDCDGYETRGKKTVVIGRGRKAVGMALNLYTWTRDLLVCTNGVPAAIHSAMTRYSSEFAAKRFPPPWATARVGLSRTRL